MMSRFEKSSHEVSPEDLLAEGPDGLAASLKLQAEACHSSLFSYQEAFLQWLEEWSDTQRTQPRSDYRMIR
jgi:hypothetical protein